MAGVERKLNYETPTEVYRNCKSTPWSRGKKVQSIKYNITSADADIETSQKKDNVKTHVIFCAIFDSRELASKRYLNQIGQFLIKWTEGNQYIFIVYHYNMNKIHAVLIKSRLFTSIT